MSAIYSLPIQITSSSIVSDHIRISTNYSVLPLSIVESDFTIIIVGYKKMGSLRVVESTKIIQADNFGITDFIRANIGIDGYFSIHETDKDKQQQILEQIPKGFELPF